MTTVRVWIPEWSFGCCGEPLQVDGPATLQVKPVSDERLDASLQHELGVITAGVTHVDASHDGEDPPPAVVTGVVREIQEVAAEYRSGDDGYALVAGTAVVTRRDTLGPVQHDTSPDLPDAEPDQDITVTNTLPDGADVLSFGMEGTATFGWFMVPEGTTEYPPMHRTAGYLITLELDDPARNGPDD